MTPNPGSPEAVEQGCKCAALSNGHGRGITHNGEQVFWMNSACPLHGRGKKEDAS